MAPELPGLHRRMRPEKGASRGMPALRLLPVVIFATVCMLGLRIAVVVQNIADARRASLQVGPASALAQAQPAAAPAGKQAAAAEKPGEKPADKTAEGQEPPK